MAKQQINGDQLGEAGGVWKSYTPSWTATGTNPVIGNGTIAGSYTRVGNTVTATINVKAGSTTTFGSGVYSFSLPINSLNNRYVGSGYALRTGSSFYPYPTSNIDIYGTITPTKMNIVNAGGGLAHSTATWANGDIFILQLTYEVS